MTQQHERATLRNVVDQLCAAQHDDLSRSSSDPRLLLPSREAVVGIVEQLRSALFPGYFGDREFDEEGLRFHVGATLDRVRGEVQEQIRRGLCLACEEPDPWRCPRCETHATTVATEFLARLPEIRRILGTDVHATYTGDPAASSPSETILCYPGILALTNYRLAHELYKLGVPLVPRMVTEYAHSITGIDIHPGTRIGEHFFIDHGTGVVIGETAVIGNRVRIYQGVTLGAKSFPLDEHGHAIKGISRHPIIEDDVTIYSGATILGRVTIGAGSVIGGNVWVTRDVPRNGRISQMEARQGSSSAGVGSDPAASAYGVREKRAFAVFASSSVRRMVWRSTSCRAARSGVNPDCWRELRNAKFTVDSEVAAQVRGISGAAESMSIHRRPR